MWRNNNHTSGWITDYSFNLDINVLFSPYQRAILNHIFKKHQEFEINNELPANKDSIISMLKLLYFKGNNHLNSMLLFYFLELKGQMGLLFRIHLLYPSKFCIELTEQDLH